MRTLPALLTLSAITGTAAADSAKPRPAPPPLRPSIMIADGLSVGMVAGGVAMFRHYEHCECEEMGSPLLVMLGIGTYLMTSAMIHHEHGRNDRAAASVALRAGLPAAALAIAYATDLDRRDALLLTATGVASAMVLDWLVLARE